MYEWIEKLYQDRDMLRMGHCQSKEDLNLGMGWLYYGFTRLLRPRNIVVIGSLRGFSPLVFARALVDNAENGEVHFIDPSLADDFWKDAASVSEYFKSHGVENIRHYLTTTQEFVKSDTYNRLDDIGIVFIDGLHTREQAKFDYEAFNSKLSDDGIIMFHDSIAIRMTRKIRVSGQKYEKNVKLFIDELKSIPELQVFDLPFAGGLTLIRKI